MALFFALFGLGVPCVAQTPDPILLLVTKEVQNNQLFAHLQWSDTSQTRLRVYAVYKSQGPQGPWTLVQVYISFGNGGEYFDPVTDGVFYCYLVQDIFRRAP
jgi:hypothetical protein